MRVWRICPRRFVADALDGSGGMHVSGRWHHRGNPVVYTASYASLAVLEVLVHVEPHCAPADLQLMTIELPDDITVESVETGALPKDWRSVPAPDSLRALGTPWLRSGRSAVLSVPSAIIESERNLLLNPQHPDLRRARMVEAVPFSFDPRLLGAASGAVAKAARKSGAGRRGRRGE
jgi:RES domain-containing protein